MTKEENLPPWKKSYDQPRQIHYNIKNKKKKLKKKKQRHCFANKDPSSQNYDFSSSHVWM